MLIVFNFLRQKNDYNLNIMDYFLLLLFIIAAIAVCADMIITHEKSTVPPPKTEDISLVARPMPTARAMDGTMR